MTTTTPTGNHGGAVMSCSPYAHPGYAEICILHRTWPTAAPGTFELAHLIKKKNKTVHCRPPWQCSATELWQALTLYQPFLRRGLPGSYACGTRFPSALCAICGERGPPCPVCTIHTPLPGDPTPGRTRAHSPSWPLPCCAPYHPRWVLVVGSLFPSRSVRAWGPALAMSRHTKGGRRWRGGSWVVARCRPGAPLADCELCLVSCAGGRW